ncbi:MAG: IS5 family transposase [Gemmatimonadaceae bacterium]|jgi:IS5 family transposase|nr:IS5 family transposase [Gemmatimonadaceae bacterium]
MGAQRTLASVVYDTKRKVTRRERFLAEMDRVIPWAAMVAVIAPVYTKPGRGRQPLPLETMLRVYFPQQWFDLSDPAAEDMLYDSESMRRFARVELGDDRVPDEATILRFRHLLEQHQRTDRLFALVQDLLATHQLTLRGGTIVDATIIAAPSSTKNRTQTRDPAMRQTKKGNQWHFGMKVHIGTDTQGLVHSVTVTDAAVADITQLPALLHGEETAVYGDKAYWHTGHRDAFEAAGDAYKINRRGPRTWFWDRVNRARSRVRARVEHAFHVMKRLWGFQKVRYRGLEKNRVRVVATLALANLYQVRHRLTPQGT